MENSKTAGSARATISSEKGKVQFKTNICTCMPSCPPQWPLPSPSPPICSTKDLSLVDSISQMSLDSCTSIHAAPSPCGFLQHLPNPNLHDASLHMQISPLQSLPPFHPFSVHHYNASTGPRKSFLTPASFSSPICCNFPFSYRTFLSLKMHHIFPFYPICRGTLPPCSPTLYSLLAKVSSPLQSFP